MKRGIQRRYSLVVLANGHSNLETQMKKILALGGAAAVILAGGTALAQTTPSHPGARHARSAAPVTRAALQARIAKVFARFDANHDGFITRQELSAIETQREQKIEQRAQRFDTAKLFDRLDLNHDGKITTAEADQARSQRAKAKGGEPAKANATAFGGLFARADANKDNAISRAEFDALGQQMKARMERAGQSVGAMGTRMFDEADANKDGRISLSEMQQSALARFDRMDLNHDGAISPRERQQSRPALKGKAKPS